MKKASTQVFSGAGLGLMLGFLLGLSSAPVVAAVVGAVAALLGAIIVPHLPSKAAVPGEQEPRTGIDLRAGALGVACVGGILAGIWLRANDVLSPKPLTVSESFQQWRAIGFSPEEARALVARGPAAIAASPSSAGPTPRSTVLFSERQSKCEQISVPYASTDAAARALDLNGEPALARVARGLSQIPDAGSRMKALELVLEAVCKGA